MLMVREDGHNLQPFSLRMHYHFLILKGFLVILFFHALLACVVSVVLSVCRDFPAKYTCLIIVFSAHFRHVVHRDCDFVPAK